MTTPLSLAIEISDANIACDVIRFLVENGADIDAPLKYDDTALSRSIYRMYDKQIPKLLLELGADIDGVNVSLTPLIAAVQSRDYMENIKFVLNYGPNVNKIAEHNGTALLQAASNNRLDAVRELVSAGADPNIKYGFGRTLLMFLCMPFESEEMIKYMLTIVRDVNETNDDGETVLDIAFKYGRHSFIKILIEGGVNVNKRDKDGKTFLMRAYEKNVDWKITNLFLDCGDLSVLDNDGKNAFMYACIFSDLCEIISLSERYPNIDGRDKNGKSAMDYATERGDEEVMEYLHQKYEK